jgi:hypothetical protein
MTVNRIGSGISPLVDFPKKNNNAKNVSASAINANDKIEISQEGKVKSLEISDPQKLAVVKERLNSGFYDKDGVINSVANSILKEIRGA